MGSSIATLKDRGLSNLGIGLIRLYQQTLSKVTPSRCRYTPSCSEYGIKAIQRFGIYEGMRLTYQRIKRCRRPFGGYDPVPATLNFSSSINPDQTTNKVSSKTNYDFKQVKKRVEGVTPTYEHQFRLILTYPTEKEFYSKQEFEKKIAEFYDYVLEVEQYTILYQVDKVEAGTLNNQYLLRFSGTTSSAYLENKVDEVVDLLVSQLEGFFVCVKPGEFKTLYFEVDGQVYIQPQPEEPTLPKEYNSNANLWNYTSSVDTWDVYWGSYLVEDLFEMFFAIADVVSNATPDMDFSSPNLDNNITDVGSNTAPDMDFSAPAPDNISDTGCDFNLFDGDGCSFPDLNGCDVGSGGCDGCDVGNAGCDGCDGCDGCSW